MIFFKKKQGSDTDKSQKSEKTVTIGRIGEDAAVKFLKQNGYTVIERNYRSGKNEIDIVASDKENIIFVEVKSRTYNDPEDMAYGRPSAAVTKEKRERTLAAAHDYLRTHDSHNKKKNKRIRFDVIEVYLRSSADGKEVYKINHIISAFSA